MILLSFRKRMTEEEEWREPYRGYVNSMTGLQLSINGVSRKDFTAELEETKGFRYALDDYPEEAISDLSILYAEIQSYLSRVTSILSEMYSYKSKLNELLRESKRIYKKARNSIFVNNAAVNKLKNQTLMEAFIDNYISDIVEVRDELEDSVDAVDDLIQIMLVHDKNLERANVNVSRQQRIIEVLIGLNYPVHLLHKKQK